LATNPCQSCIGILEILFKKAKDGIIVSKKAKDGNIVSKKAKDGNIVSDQ